MEKINIAELLKDCPNGMELDCTMFEGVFLERVDKNVEYPIVIRVGKTDVKHLTKEGCWNKYSNAKCVIFPKGRTTWEGFIPPCKFKNGDIVYIVTDECDYRICLFERIVGNNMHTIASVTSSGHFFCPCKEQFDAENFVAYRLATEEEKAKLFKAIRDNGCKWNAETKTLEEFPKFKDGDIIFIRTSNYTWVSIFKQFSGSSCCTYVDLCMTDNDLLANTRDLCNIEDIITQRLATEEEKQKLFDTIKKNGYKWNPENKTLEKLTPDKFDITTLVPFESRVLVRDSVKEKWHPGIWGFYDSDHQNYPYKLIGDIARYCIPYEGNQHLLGTADDCDEFYKTWE